MADGLELLFGTTIEGNVNIPLLLRVHVDLCTCALLFERVDRLGLVGLAWFAQRCQTFDQTLDTGPI